MRQKVVRVLRLAAALDLRKNGKMQTARLQFHALALAGALMLTSSAEAADATNDQGKPIIALAPSPVLDLVGNRPDKNSVGHGRNVALYTGSPSKFYFATHFLGDVFSAADGTTLVWYPDQVILAAPEPTNRTQDPEIIQERQVCITSNDVVVSRISWTNESNLHFTERLEIVGDCRRSADWRNKPGGEKITRRVGNSIVMLDKNVFPELMPEGLAIAIGSTLKPDEVITNLAGAYRFVYIVGIPPHSRRIVNFACAIDRNEKQALANLRQILRQDDPLAANRKAWERFYQQEVPQFESSDPKLNELYAFRWFLLKFSTAGGDLGYFKYPVVMEGRQAFQTYCCYSAPFMAFDMNWARDPKLGFGHIASMAAAAYDDGRFPWYVSPRTNLVPLDHASKTGLSLLPLAAWRFYQIHGDKALLKQLYPAMKKNMEWWITDRDPDGNGLFAVDHQLETGMDDLQRRWTGPRPRRYEAVDATAYACGNLRAVASMARELDQRGDAARFSAYAEKSARALNAIAWDGKTEEWRDHNPETGELSHYEPITIFYPLLAGVADKEHLGIVRRHLLSTNEFWLPHPIPALSKADPEFDPVKRYWAGPSWPAATSHVIEGFAAAAKQYDRTLLPQAAELLRRAVDNHMQPRADFYERCNPFTGEPLSKFRDYMHSWWIDIFIRHVAGLNPQDDGSLVIDPLPMGLKFFALRNAPYRGHSVDVLFNDKSEGSGLTVRIAGKIVLRDAAFEPGAKALPVAVPQK